jgi:predicted 3-demethylubiquinone-9 3-methyltransferase (glyoxalase superfamily)
MLLMALMWEASPDAASGVREGRLRTTRPFRGVKLMQKITTFLMFTGKAEEAMNFYTSLFPQSRVLRITRYGPNEAGAEGTVMRATFSLNGQEFMCIDSNAVHAFTFTPAMSLYVNCETEDEIARLYTQLSQGGQVLMPLERYPFSEKFAWVADKYGVSWQLNLAKHP